MSAPADRSIVHPTDATDRRHRALRTALSQFATGVAIVTTAAPTGVPIGLTVNSFSALSLDPPLILWCLQRSSTCRPAFTAAEHFVVNLLSAGQRQLADRFAASNQDRFAGVAWNLNTNGVPILSGTVGHFVCRKMQLVDGGDHIILVGQIDGYTITRALEPLIFLDGKYRRVGQLISEWKPDPPTTPADRPPEAE